MSNKILVIVESPGKIVKINNILGSDYIVKASYGHCQDLDPKTLSIEIENNYNPLYITVKGKEALVKELRGLAKTCSEVILASDQDREGEAIASSLSSLLKLKNPKRIVFHEITKKAIENAINNPKEIDYNMVHAQQARRLLDRLVGYKITPILWNHIKTSGETTQSCGRVQSVVVKIIKDKEDEINSSLNNSYFKTCIELMRLKIKINGTLTKNKEKSSSEIYKFDNLDKAKEFLNLINKKTIFQVVSVDNKESIRNASPPFITSTLQQDASTKLGYSIKLTMDIAQKLYESGYISYMRTDSTNLSQEAMNDCEKYIKKTYGDEYSRPLNYTSQVAGAQDAHECIRPTNIQDKEIETTPEGIKLYKLIWNRTVASQMSSAKINIQIIKIDTLNGDTSILKNKLWISTLESTIFDGFLILYNNYEESDEEKINGLIEIKTGDILDFKKIKISEEFTKSPLRFNEANLIKFLEKNNIGRPSTYASIINKIIDRKYVEIKDICGIKKESNQLELDTKYKIKEIVKETIVGKENKKLVPTEVGIIVNDFLVKHFDTIMQIGFTSEFETYLDKIAEGKGKWQNVIDIFYKKFNPMVEKLQMEQKIIKNTDSDKLLGMHPVLNQEIFIGTGKYGPYIKIIKDEKWKFNSIENLDITLEDAIDLLKYPIELGKVNKKITSVCKGKFGIYLKHGDSNISLNNIDINKITLEYATTLINSGGNLNVLKTYKFKNKIFNIKKGEYGTYIQVIENDTTKNIPIPKNIDIKNITLKQIFEIVK